MSGENGSEGSSFIFVILENGEMEAVSVMAMQELLIEAELTVKEEWRISVTEESLAKALEELLNERVPN